MHINPDAGEMIFDKQDLMNRLEGDTELARELVELFIKDVESKRAALRAALDRKDGPAIEREGHSLKGAASNLSTGVIRQLANRLEIAGRENDLAAAEQFYAALIPAIGRATVKLQEEVLNG